MQACHDFHSTEALLQQYIDNGILAGAGMMVTQRGKPVLEAYQGLADMESGKPVTENTIYRIHSMTKVVTAALTLLLCDAGLLHLDDPVSRYLPGFANSRIREALPDGTETIRPARTPLLVRHLLTMTSGIPYEAEDSPTETGKQVAKLVQEIWETRTADQSGNLFCFANAIGQLPLCFDPGEHWMYGFSADVLGAVLETAAQDQLGSLMEKYFFKPLRMKDTGFWVPSHKQHLLADLNAVDESGTLIPHAKDVVKRPITRKPVLEYGGGGLFSTCRDFSAFTAMLAGQGQYRDVRIMKPESIRKMYTPQLGTQADADYRANRLLHCKGVFHLGYTYGLGVRTLQEPQKEGGLISKNEFGWDGVFGTWCSIDTERDLSTVIMTQRFPFGHHLFVPGLMNEVYRTIHGGAGYENGLCGSPVPKDKSDY